MVTRIRPFRSGDFVAVARVQRAAFGRTDEADLVANLHTAERNAFELVAERDGQIVAHILFSPVGVERGDDGRALGLAVLAVAPEYQRQGIGSALVRAALTTLASGPYRMTVVPGECAYYQRFGFRAAREVGLRAPFDGCDALMALALRAGGLDGHGGKVTYAPASGARGRRDRTPEATLGASR